MLPRIVLLSPVAAGFADGATGDDTGVEKRRVSCTLLDSAGRVNPADPIDRLVCGGQNHFGLFLSHEKYV